MFSRNFLIWLMCWRKPWPMMIFQRSFISDFFGTHCSLPRLLFSNWKRLSCQKQISIINVWRQSKQLIYDCVVGLSDWCSSVSRTLWARFTFLKAPHYISLSRSVLIEREGYLRFICCESETPTSPSFQFVKTLSSLNHQQRYKTKASTFSIMLDGFIPTWGMKRLHTFKILIRVYNSR